MDGKEKVRTTIYVRVSDNEKADYIRRQLNLSGRSEAYRRGLHRLYKTLKRKEDGNGNKN